MVKQSYGKKEIINLAKEHDDFLKITGEGTLEDRLEIILKFLEEDRTKKAISHAGKKFYEEQMQLTRAKGKSFENYNFNLVDVIFLSVLITLFDQSLFKKVKNKSKIEEPYFEVDEWEEAFRKKLNSFEQLWKEKGTGVSWEVISVNLETLFYHLALMDDVNSYAREVQNEVNSISTLFEGLPDDHKIKVYNEFMKTRIKYIKKGLIAYTKSLKNYPAEYEFYKAYKRMIEIDKKFNSGDR